MGPAGGDMSGKHCSTGTTAESEWTCQPQRAREQTPRNNFEWVRQQTPGIDGMPHWACMGQQQQQKVVMPKPGTLEGHQAQHPMRNTEYLKAHSAATGPQTASRRQSTPGFQKRCRPAPEPEANAIMRGSVTSARTGIEQLSSFKRAMFEVQQGRAAQPLSMDSLPTPRSTMSQSMRSSTIDSLPSYQGTTMDTLPPMDGVDEASGGCGQTLVVALMKDLTGSDECTRAKALCQVADSMWPMALQNYGCRVAQTAFEVADQDQVQLLAEGLRGHIREAIESPHGNRVVQKCIESNYMEGAEIVLDEMRKDFSFFAQHRFGYRILESLLEHCTCPQVSEMVDEMLLNIGELITHPYGNFVIQHILVYGTTEDQDLIVKYLVMDIYNLSRHRVTSLVIEAAFKHSCLDKKRLLVEVLSSNPAELALLEQSPVGSIVVREMMRVQADMTRDTDCPRMF